MRQIFIAIAASIATLGTPAAAQGDWTTTLNTETRYFWSASNGGVNQRVQQVYAPVALQVVGKPNDDWKIENVLRGGHLWSQTQLRRDFSNIGRYNGWTDTTVGTTVTYLSINGIQPFASINVNVPTGQTVLRGAQSLARNLDSDVVDTPAFGEGWNVGTTLGATISLSRELMVTLSSGYTGRGPYRREIFTGATGTAENRFNPGDTWAGNAEAVYRNGAWTLSGSASFTTESQTTFDNAAFYKSGDRYSVSGSAGYVWNQNWSSKLAGTFSHSNRNNILVTAVSPLFLIPESFNSNSNVTRITADTTYSNGPFAITPVVGWLYRDHNAYDGTNLRFLPAKTKWWVGAGTEYSINDKVTITGRVERMWLHENFNPDKILFIPPPVAGTGTMAIETTAWLTSLAALVRF